MFFSPILGLGLDWSNINRSNFNSKPVVSQSSTMSTFSWTYSHKGSAGASPSCHWGEGRAPPWEATSQLSQLFLKCALTHELILNVIVSLLLEWILQSKEKNIKASEQRILWGEKYNIYMFVYIYVYICVVCGYVCVCVYPCILPEVSMLCSIHYEIDIYCACLSMNQFP